MENMDDMQTLAWAVLKYGTSIQGTPSAQGEVSLE